MTERPVAGRRVFRVCALLYVLGLAALVLPGGERRVSLLLFHTNDIHGWIMPRPSGGGPAVGGMAALSSYLARQPGPFLLLDAGDLYQGTPEGSLTRGEAVVECMNVLKYDAAAVGNHEFDDGVDNLRALTERAQFPFLAANLSDTRPSSRVPKVKPWIVRDLRGVRVGIFGLTSSRTPEMSFARNVEGLEFEEETAAAHRAVEELRRAGADVLVALTHLGWEKPDRPNFFGDRALARGVEGIDLVIGGHTHTPLRRLQWVGKTRVVQAGSRLGWVGRVRLVWDARARRIVRTGYRLLPLGAPTQTQDVAVRSLVDYYAQVASKLLGVDLNRVVGASERELTRAHWTESPLGNWLTDVMRRASGADVALHNSGGIRDNLPEGPVRVRDLYQISPFGNTMVHMRLPGDVLWEILEHGVSGAQGILQVSGLRMEYNPSAPPGRRVTAVWIGGTPLSPDQWYRVATNSFLAQGGDGYEGFKQGRDRVDTNRTLLDLQIEAMRDMPPSAAKPERRIVRL